LHEWIPYAIFIWNKAEPKSGMDYGKGTPTSRNDAIKSLTEEFTTGTLLNKVGN
jgi:hypothetical protein